MLNSHHTKPEVLTWLETNKVYYVLGLATNAVLQRKVVETWPGLEALYAQADRLHQPRLRNYHDFYYAARVWGKNQRRVFGRVEIGWLGADSRFVVSDLTGGTVKQLYENIYCDRAYLLARGWHSRPFRGSACACSDLAPACQSRRPSFAFIFRKRSTVLFKRFLPGLLTSLPNDCPKGCPGRSHNRGNGECARMLSK